jgi:hypothetical protein
MYVVLSYIKKNVYSLMYICYSNFRFPTMPSKKTSSHWSLEVSCRCRLTQFYSIIIRLKHNIRNYNHGRYGYEIIMDITETLQKWQEQQLMKSYILDWNKHTDVTGLNWLWIPTWLLPCDCVPTLNLFLIQQHLSFADLVFTITLKRKCDKN